MTAAKDKNPAGIGEKFSTGRDPVTGARTTGVIFGLLLSSGWGGLLAPAIIALRLGGSRYKARQPGAACRQRTQDNPTKDASPAAQGPEKENERF